MLAVALGLSLTACVVGDKPDLVRAEKLPGEAYSPAEQFRILSSGRELNSEYFLNRGHVQGIDVLGSGQSEDGISEELQARVARLEAQAEAKKDAEKGHAPADSKKAEQSTPAAVLPAIPPAATSKPVPPAEPQVAKANKPAAAVPESIKARLRLLMELKEDKLITDEQYRAKTKEILEEL